MADRIFYPFVALFSVVLFAGVYFDFVPVKIPQIITVGLDNYEDPSALEAEMKNIKLADHHVEVDLSKKLDPLRTRLLAAGNLLRHNPCDPELYYAYQRALGDYGHSHREASEKHQKKWITTDDRRITSTIRQFILNGKIGPNDGYNVSLHDDALKELHRSNRTHISRDSEQTDYYYKCRKKRRDQSAETVNGPPTLEDRTQETKNGTAKKNTAKESAKLKAMRQAVLTAASRVRSNSCSKKVRRAFVKTFVPFAQHWARHGSGQTRGARKLTSVVNSLSTEGRVTKQDFKGHSQAEVVFVMMALERSAVERARQGSGDQSLYDYYSKCAK